MFPDPNIRWRPYPSIIDGIKEPPFVFVQGTWRGKLCLIVLEGPPAIRFYGVEIDCHIYGAFDEMTYSIVQHGDRSGNYRGGAYIKEAVTSTLLEALREVHPMYASARHFLFVGGDYCFETVGPAEPTVRTFPSEEAAYGWKLGS